MASKLVLLPATVAVLGLTLAACGGTTRDTSGDSPADEQGAGAAVSAEPSVAVTPGPALPADLCTAVMLAEVEAITGKGYLTSDGGMDTLCEVTSSGNGLVTFGIEDRFLNSMAADELKTQQQDTGQFVKDVSGFGHDAFLRTFQTFGEQQTELWVPAGIAEDADSELWLTTKMYASPETPGIEDTLTKLADLVLTTLDRRQS